LEDAAGLDAKSFQVEKPLKSIRTPGQHGDRSESTHSRFKTGGERERRRTMSLNDIDDRKRLAYLLNLSPDMKHPRPWRMFIGIAVLVGLILALTYIGLLTT
jgi:hypothetical protein